MRGWTDVLVVSGVRSIVPRRGVRPRCHDPLDENGCPAPHLVCRLALRTKQSDKLEFVGGRTEILTVELKKLGGITGKTVEQMSVKERWALFMVYYRERVDKKTGILQKIIRTDDGIAAADQVIRGFTETELERIAARARDKFEFDAREELWEMKEAAREEGLVAGRAEGLSKGRAEGLTKGRTEGRTEALKDTARKLKSMGIPLDQIIEASGLSAGVIESL